MLARRNDPFLSTLLSHRRDLTAAALRLTGSTDEADDLVQETIMRAWLFRDQFVEGTNAHAWMQRILRNTFINHYRKRRREREVLAEHVACLRSAAPAPERVAPPGESLGDEVERALDGLPTEFREVLGLVDAEDASYREAASTLGCPIGTVMSRLHRARRAMQARLRDYALKEGYVDAA